MKTLEERIAEQLEGDIFPHPVRALLVEAHYELTRLRAVEKRAHQEAVANMDTIAMLRAKLDAEEKRHKSDMAWMTNSNESIAKERNEAIVARDQARFDEGYAKQELVIFKREMQGDPDFEMRKRSALKNVLAAHSLGPAGLKLPLSLAARFIESCQVTATFRDPMLEGRTIEGWRVRALDEARRADRLAAELAVSYERNPVPAPSAHALIRNETFETRKRELLRCARARFVYGIPLGVASNLLQEAIDLLESLPAPSAPATFRDMTAEQWCRIADEQAAYILRLQAAAQRGQAQDPAFEAERLASIELLVAFLGAVSPVDIAGCASWKNAMLVIDGRKANVRRLRVAPCSVGPYTENGSITVCNWDFERPGQVHDPAFEARKREVVGILREASMRWIHCDAKTSHLLTDVVLTFVGSCAAPAVPAPRVVTEEDHRDAGFVRAVGRHVMFSEDAKAACRRAADLLDGGEGAVTK